MPKIKITVEIPNEEGGKTLSSFKIDKPTESGEVALVYTSDANGGPVMRPKTPPRG